MSATNPNMGKHTEIAKPGSPVAKGVIWFMIVDTSTLILGEKSKDLMVTCYVCLSLYESSDAKWRMELSENTSLALYI